MSGTNSVVVTLARVLKVAGTDDTLSVDLEDGRTVSVPIGWYPRLAHGTDSEPKISRSAGRVMECIGLTSMRTLASKECCSVNDLRKAQAHSSIGCNVAETSFSKTPPDSALTAHRPLLTGSTVSPSQSLISNADLTAARLKTAATDSSNHHPSFETRSCQPGSSDSPARAVFLPVRDSLRPPTHDR